MLSRIIYFTAAFIIPFIPLAQSEEDSLKKIATTAVYDTSVIDANRQLCVMYQERNSVIAIAFGLAALKKAVAINDRLRTAQCMQSTGIGYDYKGDLDSCLFYLHHALDGYKQLNRIDKQSHVLTDIGFAYYFRGNYELALRNHLASLELRKKLGEKKFIAMSYNNIGLVYRARKDYTNALKFYQQSYQIKESEKNEAGMLNSLINISGAYQGYGKFDSALFYSYKTLSLARKINSEEDIVASKENIAAALVNLNKADEALPYLSDAEKNNTYGKVNVNLLSTSEVYGDLYVQKKDFNKAILYYTRGLTVAKSNNRKEATGVFYRKLSRCFYAVGNYKAAYQYFDSSKTIADTLLNTENSRQINEMSAVYESVEKEKQIERLNTANIISSAEARSRGKERNYFMLSTTLFLGLTLLAYKAYTGNKRKKEQLNTQNKIIEQSLAEKEILLREIHHRVKNNLQIVGSLLSLQSNYTKDEQALNALLDGRNRVESMGLIHRNLYQEHNLTVVDIRDYISNLCDNLFQSYNIQNDRIQLKKEIEAIGLDVDTVIPVGLILNELITNCLKYAFTDNREGVITIMLKEENKMLLLSVHDNGVGIDEKFDAKNKNSFGYRMINAFLQKLKGKINIYNSNGAKVDIEISNYKKAII